jgi:hypothetical protein
VNTPSVNQQETPAGTSRQHQDGVLSCKKCQSEFTSATDLDTHVRFRHLESDNAQVGSGPPHPPTEFPWQLDDGTIDTPLQNIYDKYKQIIFRPFHFGKIQDEYNFPLKRRDVGMAEIKRQLETIFQQQKNAFKINFSFGYVLRNVEGDLRYFYAHNNESILESPFVMSTLTDLNQLVRKLEEMDFLQKVFMQRPNTTWSVYAVTNVRWIVTRTTFFLGMGRKLPAYIKNRKCIIALEQDRKHKRFYTQNLCFFRALAYHYTHKAYGLEKETLRLFRMFSDSEDITAFKGISLEQIPKLEQIFQINVNIYQLNEDESIDCMFRSRGAYKDTMNLNAYENHLSYIKTMSTYAGKFTCRNCNKMFKTTSKLNRHEGRCSEATQYRFPGGYHTPRNSIFDDLETNGIFVKMEDRFHDYFIVYDFEAIIQNCANSDGENSNTNWTAEHKAVSVSIASNLPGYTEPVCFINPDQKELLDSMLKYMTEIQNKASQLIRGKFTGAVSALKSLKDKYAPTHLDSVEKDGYDNESDVSEREYETDTESTDGEWGVGGSAVQNTCEPPSAEFLKKLQQPNTFATFLETLPSDNSLQDPRYLYSGDEYTDGEDEESDVEMPSVSGKRCRKQSSKSVKRVRAKIKNVKCGSDCSVRYYKSLCEISKRFDTYLEQVAVLGFNCGKYDLNLIKRDIASVLMLPESKERFVVKSNNCYKCLSNEKFKFLDITQYLAPGCSYDQFLKAFGSEVRKGYMPYEWFDTVDKLDYPDIPAFDSFFSSLKGVNVLDQEYQEFVNLIQNEGLNQIDALNKMKLDAPPQTGIQKYEDLQNLWNREKMKTFSDYLKYYNNLDVGPFVSAVEIMLGFYREKNIDVFKTTISIPGIARQLLFTAASESGHHFALFDEKTKDIYQLFKKNIVGGPSIVFHRYHEVDKTYIRGGTKLCQGIQGYDSNALYLHSIGQGEMPTGPMTIRREETGFKKEKRDRYLKAFTWLEWITKKEGMHIQHAFNSKSEKKVGVFRVDGYCPQNNTIFEFNGCYFHGHDCWMTKNIKTLDWHSKREAIYKRTLDRAEFIMSENYPMRVIFECQYETMKRQNPEFQEFVQTFERPLDKYSTLSTKQVLNHLESGRLFGALEVDISVPENLTQKFSEMCPIFANCDVSLEHAGDHMRQHIIENKLSTKPRRLLVGGMKAEKILLASPLLQWYVDHGLLITRIYTVIEFTPAKCFESFVQYVTATRRAGDVDPALAIRGETAKVIGNSAFGSLIMNKEKHQTVEYVRGIKKASQKVNDRRFRALTELENDCFEIELAKQRICLDLPIQAGYFILQLAKLRMLQFYYDVIDRFVSRQDFQLLNMDTDSMYLALSTKTLEQAIIPEKRGEYDIIKNDWFPRQYPPEASIFDRRVPGLFKLENEGNICVSLCSKTYCLVDNHKHGVKFSCKGLNKSQFKNPIDIYKSVLFSEQAEGGTNIGFRPRDNSIFTYTQYKKSFSYVYLKRIVLDDKISTRHLQLTLRPQSGSVDEGEECSE